MQVTTIGVDQAKNIFQIHSITESDEMAFSRPFVAPLTKLGRGQIMTGMG